MISSKEANILIISEANIGEDTDVEANLIYNTFGKYIFETKKFNKDNVSRIAVVISPGVKYERLDNFEDT